MNFDANLLLKFYEGSRERVGFVLDTGEIVEVENICEDAENGFEVRGSDLMLYIESAKATWHTHPGESCNPSKGDYQSFLNYPNLDHYIVGKDGISRHIVVDGRVICDTPQSIPSRLT